MFPTQACEIGFVWIERPVFGDLSCEAFALQQMTGGVDPEIMTDLSASQLYDLGQEYMDRSRIHRGTAPFFIDKMPNNFMHVGLIHLILPNAKIRRLVGLITRDKVSTRAYAAGVTSATRPAWRFQDTNG